MPFFFKHLMKNNYLYLYLCKWEYKFIAPFNVHNNDLFTYPFLPCIHIPCMNCNMLHPTHLNLYSPWHSFWLQEDYLVLLGASCSSPARNHLSSDNSYLKITPKILVFIIMYMVEYMPYKWVYKLWLRLSV